MDTHGFKPIIDEKQLRKAIIEHLPGIDREKVESEKLTFRQLVNKIPSEKNSDEIIDVFLKDGNFIDFEAHAIREIELHKLEFYKEAEPVCLKIYVELEISLVGIPDPQKDEVVLSMMLQTGVHTDNLKDYLLENELVSPEELARFEDKWKSHDIGIDIEEREKALLERVLRLEIQEGYDPDIRYIIYNFIEAERDLGPVLWRTCGYSTPVRIPLDYADYPFDRHLISFYLISPYSFDVTDQFLQPDMREDVDSLVTKGLVPPRSLKLSSSSGHLLDVCPINRLDIIPESMIRFDLGFSRTSASFLWNTYIPFAVISIFSILGTIYGTINNNQDYLNALLTTLLPTVLISVVALQLIAAQSVPRNTGHTKQDYLFISYYISFLLFFIALELKGHPVIQNILLIISSLIVLSGLIFFGLKIIKSIK